MGNKTKTTTAQHRAQGALFGDLEGLPTFGNAFGKLREGPASDQWLNFLEEVLQLTSRTNFILTASTKLRRKLKRLTDVQSSLQGKCTKGTGAPRPDLDFPLMDLGESQLCLKLHKMN